MLAIPAHLLTPPDAATILSCSVKHLYKLVQNGALPAIRLGGRIRFQPDDIRDLINKSAATPKDAQ